MPSIILLSSVCLLKDSNFLKSLAFAFKSLFSGVNGHISSKTPLNAYWFFQGLASTTLPLPSFVIVSLSFSCHSTF